MQHFGQFSYTLRTLYRGRDWTREEKNISKSADLPQRKWSSFFQFNSQQKWRFSTPSLCRWGNKSIGKFDCPGWKSNRFHRKSYTKQRSLVYLAFIAVVSGFHVSLTQVAAVDKPIPALIVKLDQHGHRGKLGSSQRWEFVVLLAGKGQESVPAIHNVTVHERIRITRFGRLSAVQSNNEKYLCE